MENKQVKENEKQFLEAVEEAKQRLAAGESPYDVFTWCGSFHEGFACVVLNNKWNYINHDGKLLSDTWFEDCWIFKKGFVWVELNGIDYLLRKDGVLCDFYTTEPVKMEE